MDEIIDFLFLFFIAFVVLCCWDMNVWEEEGVVYIGGGGWCL